MTRWPLRGPLSPMASGVRRYLESEARKFLDEKPNIRTGSCLPGRWKTMSSSRKSPSIPPVTINSHRSPHSFFTPTHIDFHDLHTRLTTATWQSRRARKGRYAPKSAHVHLSSGNEGQDVSGRVRHLESELKPGLRADISFWVAMAFTFGSMVWVVNGTWLQSTFAGLRLLRFRWCVGFLVWFPILRPALATTTYYNTASAFAFIGGSIFEIGSYLMVVEALDRYLRFSF